MSCAGTRGRLSEFVRGELAPRDEGVIQAHLAGCPACAKLRDETFATLSLLRRAGDDTLPADFTASLHRKLVAAPAPAPAGFVSRLLGRASDLFLARPVTMTMISSGAALSLSAALFLGVPALRGRLHEAAPVAVAAGDVAPIFVVPRARIAVVRIDFVAEQDIDDVAFAIRLPEGLHFVSEGRELPDREFHWRGRLTRGSNPIPVAVRGARSGRYTLAAHAVGPDLDAMQNVVLEVTSG